MTNNDFCYIILTGDIMSKFLNELASFVRHNDFNVFRVAEIKDGVSECITLASCNNCQDSYSVAKVFVVTAIGLLYDKGLISTDEKVTDILKNYLDDSICREYHSLTVHHLLTHRLGLPAGFLDIDSVDSKVFGEDFLDYIFKTKPTHKVGVDSVYTDGAFYVLSRIVSEKAGMPLDTFLWENLLFPLGFSEAAFSKCPKGHAIGATGLYIKTADMAKLGQLYLSFGEYNGKRLLSKEWVNTVFEKGYELHKRKNAFLKGGMNGQMLMIIPYQNRVVAWHSFEPKGVSPLTDWVVNYDE